MDSLKAWGASMLESAQQGLQGKRRKFRIGQRTVTEDQQLAEGGFAYVWRVHDAAGQEFAMKKILCQDRESYRTAQREADLLLRLPRHPHIIQCFGTSTVQEGNHKCVLILMEMCPGGHLLDYMDQHGGKLSENQILVAFQHIALAVKFLHEQEPPIQHRDLKIENVLMGRDGKWKLCDFGSWCAEPMDREKMTKQEIALAQEHAERTTTMIYRPPELVDISKSPGIINEQLDIWMMGCILFTLMFFRHPFQDEGSLAILNVRYITGKHKCSTRLEDLMHWCLAFAPAERPTSTDLVNILAKWKDDTTPITLPEEVSARLAKQRKLYGKMREDDLKPIDTAELQNAVKRSHKKQPKRPSPDVQPFEASAAASSAPPQWDAFETNDSWDPFGSTGQQWGSFPETSAADTQPWAGEWSAFTGADPQPSCPDPLADWASFEPEKAPQQDWASFGDSATLCKPNAVEDKASPQQAAPEVLDLLS